jgi:hypothetical protein
VADLTSLHHHPRPLQNRGAPILLTRRDLLPLLAFVVGTSPFSNSISSDHFICLAGPGASDGLAGGAVTNGRQASASFCSAGLRRLLPEIESLRDAEFPERRFNSKCRRYLTIVLRQDLGAPFRRRGSHPLRARLELPHNLHPARRSLRCISSTGHIRTRARITWC